MFEKQVMEYIKRYKAQIAIMSAEIDALINKMQTGHSQVVDYPLTEDTTKFKGKKPCELILPGGRKIQTTKWNEVVLEILKDANRYEICHQQMLELRGRISGKSRCFLQGTPEGMDSPFKIDEDLYFETKLDTESLLRFLVLRVLPCLSYDREKIKIGMLI